MNIAWVWDGELSPSVVAAVIYILTAWQSKCLNVQRSGRNTEWNAAFPSESGDFNRSKELLAHERELDKWTLRSFLSHGKDYSFVSLLGGDRHLCTSALLLLYSPNQPRYSRSCLSFFHCNRSVLVMGGQVQVLDFTWTGNPWKDHIRSVTCSLWNILSWKMWQHLEGCSLVPDDSEVFFPFYRTYLFPALLSMKSVQDLSPSGTKFSSSQRFVHFHVCMSLRQESRSDVLRCSMPDRPCMSLRQEPRSEVLRCSIPDWPCTALLWSIVICFVFKVVAS